MPDSSPVFYTCCLVTERLRYSFNHVIPVSGWHPHLSGSSSPRIGGIPGLRLVAQSLDSFAVPPHCIGMGNTPFLHTSHKRNKIDRCLSHFSNQIHHH